MASPAGGKPPKDKSGPGPAHRAFIGKINNLNLRPDTATQAENSDRAHRGLRTRRRGTAPRSPAAAGPPVPPTVATPAAVAPSPVPFGTTARLSVLGAGGGGEPSLTYTWTSEGPAPVAFSANGTNAAKNATATFTVFGAYAFTVTIQGNGGLKVTSSVGVTVNPPEPTVATPAAVASDPVIGTTARLSVLGAGGGGEPTLTYSWVSSGPAPVTFTPNDANAAKNTTATFTKFGAYGFSARIKNSVGAWVSSHVAVMVKPPPPPPPTLTSIAVYPSSAVVKLNGTQQFTALAKDQFGTTLSPQPSFAWSVRGMGTVNSGGLFTAGTVGGGPFTVTAASGGKSGTAVVNVTSGGPIKQTDILMAAKGYLDQADVLLRTLPPLATRIDGTITELTRQLRALAGEVTAAHGHLLAASRSATTRRETTRGRGTDLEALIARVKTEIKVPGEAPYRELLESDTGTQARDLLQLARDELAKFKDYTGDVDRFDSDDAIFAIQLRGRADRTGDALDRWDTQSDQLQQKALDVVGAADNLIESSQGSVKEVFGSGLDIPAGGIEKRISAVALDKVLGKGAGKDDGTRAEMEKLANLLIPKIAERVRASAGGLDANAVDALPAPKKAKLADEAGNVALEILKTIKENKRDRKLATAQQAITTAGAVGRAGLGVARAVASSGADVLAYVQIAKALKTIVGVVKEARQSVETRATALTEALKKVSPLDAKTKADALKGFVSSARAVRAEEWESALTNFKAAVAKLAGDLPKAKTARVMHGSKTASLNQSWQAMMDGMAKLQAEIEGLPPDKKPTIPSVEANLAALIGKTMETGALFEKNLDLQIKAAAQIDAVGTIRKQAATISAVLVAGSEGREYVTDVCTQVDGLISHAAAPVTFGSLFAEAGTALDQVEGFLGQLSALV